VSAGDAVVTWLRERLQVVFGEEQRLVAVVRPRVMHRRRDVVHVGAAASLALAEHRSRKHLLPQPSPASGLV
jgi:hypothetical protein